jgi:hypothetical protein
MQDFSPFHLVQTGSGFNPASYLVAIGGSFSGGKQPERGTNHSPLTTAEIKNTWIYTSIPPYVFMA